MDTRISVRDGTFRLQVWSAGSGDPLVFLHGAGGLLGLDPFLDELAKTFTVYAPSFPGYGESEGVEAIDEVLDATLCYDELLTALGLDSAFIVGHSMGGMLGAELAALAPQRVKKLVLVCPAGFWLDEHPIPDFFAMTPEDLVQALFHDPTSALAQSMMAVPSDEDALTAMLIERVKRLAAAARILWPIPDRGLRKRIHRIAAPTLLLWGESDRLIPLVYAEEFLRRLKNAKLQTVREAGHMLPYEQTAEFVRLTTAFLK